MTREEVAIGAHVWRDVLAHACAEFPRECCGYLTGPRDRPATIDRVVRCHNAQTDAARAVAPGRTAETAFAIDGVELLGFARSLISDAPARVVYHSHSNGAAYFSALDREVAVRGGYPVAHLVIGVDAGGVVEAALFELVDGVPAQRARWDRRALAAASDPS